MQCARILILDEDTSFYESIKSQLSEDYELTNAVNYSQAHSLLQNQKYSLLVIDIKGSDETFEMIDKLLQIDSQLQVIITSVDSGPSLLLRLYSYPLFAFIHKPGKKMSEICHCIKSAIDLKATPLWQVSSATQNWVEIIMPTNIKHVAPICDFLDNFIQELECRERRMVLYALRELVQNAVEHGNQGCLEKNIYIHYTKFQKFLLFSVRDQGQGFNLDSLPHAAIGPRQNAPIDVVLYRKQTGMRPGGLGISSVMGIADELIYNQKGNAVTMIKYLPTD